MSLTSEWIVHDGSGDPDVSGDSLIKVYFRDKTFGYGRAHDWDQNWTWTSEFHPGEILAWRHVDTPTVRCQVATMRTSDGGADYYVHLECEGREITPHSFKERWKAEYEVAEWRWFFGQGEKPDVLTFREDST